MVRQSRKAKIESKELVKQVWKAPAPGEVQWYEPTYGRRMSGLQVSIGTGRNAQMRISPDLVVFWPTDAKYVRVGRQGGAMVLRPFLTSGLGALTLQREGPLQKISLGAALRTFGWEVMAPSTFAAAWVAGDLVVDMSRPLHVGHPPKRRRRKGDDVPDGHCATCASRGTGRETKCENDESPNFDKIVGAQVTCTCYEQEA
jgi:hypothetical protein